MILYQDCSSHLDSSKNTAARGRGLFSLYIYIENFKNLLVRNHWTDFNIILQECLFGDPVPRLFKPPGFVKKHGCQGAELIFPTCIYLYGKLLKASCQNHWADFNIILQKGSFSNPLPRLFKPFGFLKKHGHQRAGLIFPIYIYTEKFKNLLVRNHWTDFNITRQECFFCNFLPRLFKPSWYVKNHGRQGGGTFFF